MIIGLHRILELVEALLWATWSAVTLEKQGTCKTVNSPTKTGGLGGAGIQTLLASTEA